jgi:hypothetical protein
MGVENIFWSNEVLLSDHGVLSNLIFGMILWGHAIKGDFCSQNIVDEQGS